MVGSWARAGRRPPTASSHPAGAAIGTHAAAIAGYGFALAMVVVAGVAAFGLLPVISAPNVALVFVLPVVVAAVAFGWGPALTAAIAGVLAFDFFFTRPYHSLRIESPHDLYAAGLLLVIAAIVSSVAARSRRGEMAAREAAEQAEALHALACLVADGAQEWEVLRAAVCALTEAFRAPAVILLRSGESLAPVASAGEARLTEADREAALAALDRGVPIRGGTYPFERAEFDFWPMAEHGGLAWAVGVGFLRAGAERPGPAGPYVDLVRGLAAAAVAMTSGEGHG